MHFVAAVCELEPQLGGHNTAASVSGIASDADLHAVLDFTCSSHDSSKACNIYEESSDSESTIALSSVLVKTQPKMRTLKIVRANAATYVVLVGMFGLAAGPGLVALSPR